MYLIELTYKKEIVEVERFVKEHIEFLDQKYAEGVLIFSGRKNPRTGGVILANLNSSDQVQLLIQQDPFYREQIAEYRVIEFIPTKFDARFSCFVN